MSKYQLMSTDQHFIENSQHYIEHTSDSIQYLYNPSQLEDPIYQVKMLIRQQSCFIGNYCTSNSCMLLIQKVDPLLIAIQMCGEKFKDENKGIEIEALFLGKDKDQLNKFQCYLKDRKSLLSRMHLIADIISANEETYYKLNKEKLFKFIETKIDKLEEYIKKDTQETFKSNFMNTKHDKIMEREKYNLILEYLSHDLSVQFQKSHNLLNSLQYQADRSIQQHEKNEEKKVQINKKESQAAKKSSQKQAEVDKVAKSCMKMDMFFMKKKKSE